MGDPDRIAAAGTPGIEGLAHPPHELPRAFAAATRPYIREIPRPGVDLGAVDGRPELLFPHRRYPSRRCAGRRRPRPDRDAARRWLARVPNSATRANRSAKPLQATPAPRARPRHGSLRAAREHPFARSRSHRRQWSAHGARAAASCPPRQREVDRQFAHLLRRTQAVPGEPAQPAPQQPRDQPRGQRHSSTGANPRIAPCVITSQPTAGSDHATPTSKAPLPIASASGFDLLAAFSSPT